jgi:hypothetical protein
MRLAKPFAAGISGAQLWHRRRRDSLFRARRRIVLALEWDSKGRANLLANWVKEIEMNALGLALLVGGAALVVSGLVFLLPIRRKQLQQRETFQEGIERIDHHLQEMRRERGDLS